MNFVRASNRPTWFCRSIIPLALAASIGTLHSQCFSPPLGLVSWWRAEENAADSADSNPGALRGGVSFTAGKAGQAFVFSTTNSAVRIAASSNLNVGLGAGFTVEGWINPSDVASQHPILEWNNVVGGNPYPHGVHFWISVPGFGNGPGSVFANIEDSAGGNHYMSSAAGLLVTNSFQHVGVSYDKATGVARLYLNGVVIAQQNLGVFTPLTSYDIFLGQRPAPAVFTFAGLMDEMSLYNRALTTNEMQGIYAAGGLGKCSSGAAPVITRQPTDQTVAVGATASFTVEATGSLPLNYQWRFNGTNIAGATGTALSLSNVQLAQGGNYSVRVTNSFGSAITSNAVLKVNRAPVANAQAVGLDEDTAASIVLSGSDADGDTLSFAIVTSPSHGSLSGTPPSLVYRPSMDYYGSDSFSFKANDGALDSTPALVSITIRPVNDRPVAQPQAVVLDEDTTQVIILQAFDVDGDSLTYSVGVPTHGTLSGIAPNLTYRPATNYFGPDSFTFTVNDGRLESAPTTVSITVTPVNDAPIGRIDVSPLLQIPDVTKLARDFVEQLECSGGFGWIIID